MVTSENLVNIQLLKNWLDKHYCRFYLENCLNIIPKTCTYTNIWNVLWTSLQAELWIVNLHLVSTLSDEGVNPSSFADTQAEKTSDSSRCMVNNCSKTQWNSR